MAAIETSSSIDIQCRVDEIVSELQRYIAAGFTSGNKVVTLLLNQEGRTMSEPDTKTHQEQTEQPSAAEVNVSNCST